MDSKDMIFKGRKLLPDKLAEQGFEPVENGYARSFAILEGQFCMRVCVSMGGDVRAVVIDAASHEEYILHRVPGAGGAFVGRVKAAYEQVLQDIAESCFEPDVFRSEYARAIIVHARETYGDDLEFLWKRFPENAVLRRKDSGKWYAALLRLPGCKLGLETGETIEILDLRMRPEEIKAAVDGRRYFPGYHMNKQHWVSIRMDGSVPLDEIFMRMHVSYQLAKK